MMEVTTSSSSSVAVVREVWRRGEVEPRPYEDAAVRGYVGWTVDTSTQFAGQLARWWWSFPAADCVNAAARGLLVWTVEGSNEGDLSDRCQPPSAAERPRLERWLVDTHWRAPIDGVLAACGYRPTSSAYVLLSRHPITDFRREWCPNTALVTFESTASESEVREIAGAIEAALGDDRFSVGETASTLDGLRRWLNGPACRLAHLLGFGGREAVEVCGGSLG